MFRIHLDIDFKEFWCELFHRKYHRMLVGYWVECGKCGKHPRTWAWKNNMKNTA